MKREKGQNDVLGKWLAKYTPVEREILADRARRLDRAVRRREREWKPLFQTDWSDGYETATGRKMPRERYDPYTAFAVFHSKSEYFLLPCLVKSVRKQAGRVVDRIRHRVKRPLYYAAENARRRDLAEARRRVTRRTTENPCPTREAILEAWTLRRSSHDAAIRFGSLIEDLECYLDNSLLRDEAGAIVGRRGGVKQWLQTEMPALYLRYTTVMRYKSAARKLRQIAEVTDPTPAVRIVEKTPSPPPFLVRARAIWREVTAGVAPSATALMTRLDRLLDPERVEDANLLAKWRTRHKNEITVRTKSCGDGVGWRRGGKDETARGRPRGDG